MSIRTAWEDEDGFQSYDDNDASVVYVGNGTEDQSYYVPQGDNDAPTGLNGDASVDQDHFVGSHDPLHDDSDSNAPLNNTTSSSGSSTYESPAYSSVDQGTGNTEETYTAPPPTPLSDAEANINNVIANAELNIANSTPKWDPETKALVQYTYIKDANGSVVIDTSVPPRVVHDFSAIAESLEGFDAYILQLSQLLESNQPVEFQKQLADYLGTDTLAEFGQQYQDAQQRYATAMQQIQGQTEAVTTEAGGLTTNQGVRDGAEDWFARLAGFENRDQVIGSQQDMMSSLMSGVGSQEGLTNQERSMMQHSVDRNVQSQEKMLQRQVDGIMGTTGSTMQAIAMADESRQQISNARLQGEMAIMLEDFARKQQNFENKKQIWGNLLEQGRITQQTFIDSIRQDKALQLQGLAVQASNMESMYRSEMQSLDSQYNMAYQSWQGEANIHFQNENLKMQKMQNDINIVSTSIQTLYQRAQMEMGMTQMAIQTEMQYRQLANDEQQMRLNWATAQWEMARYNQEAKEAKNKSFFANLFGGIAVVAGLVLAPFTGGSSLTLAAGGLSAITA